MIIAHKIRLDPNNAQRQYFSRASGTARFAYNWGLDQWQKQYQAWKQDNSLSKPSEAALRRQLNAIKRAEFPWMLEVTKCAPQEAIRQLGKAFQNFFAGRTRLPKFKKKGFRDRFSLSNGNIAFNGKSVRIPILGWVRMFEPLRFQGRIVSATISRVADRWFISVAVETSEKLRIVAETQGTVGVDLGVKALATLSTGEVVIGPKPLKTMLARLRRANQALSRKVKGSSNRHKAKMKVARLHAHIANIRNDALHKLTTDLTRRFNVIGIEDLNVQGMVRNHHLARALSDMSFFEFRRQLEYKAKMCGDLVVVANRFFPSSKTCSSCGYRLDVLPLGIREWVCPGCRTSHDRDVNAAINLEKYAVSSTVSACGE